MPSYKTSDLTEEDPAELTEIYKLIHDSINSWYNLEWDRSKILDGKASSIISLVGIILALQSGIGATLIKDESNLNQLTLITNSFFIISIICLTFAILFSLNAYFIKATWNIPNPEFVYEKFDSGAKLNQKETIKVISSKIKNLIDANNKVNNDKEKNISNGLKFLVAGILSNLLFIIGLTYVTGHLY